METQYAGTKRLRLIRISRNDTSVLYLGVVKPLILELLSTQGSYKI